MIVNSFPSLSEKFLLNQCAALKKQGIELTVFSATTHTEDHVHALYKEAALEENTISLRIPRNSTMRLLKGIPLIGKLLLTHPLLLIKSLKFAVYKTMAVNLKTVFFLDCFLKQQKTGIKYDLIHCQFGQNGFLGAFLTDCKFAETFVVTFHGSDITAFPRKHGAAVYKNMFSKASIITCGTQFIQKKLLEHGCPPEKIRILPVGIRSEDYALSKLSSDTLQLLSVGRLAPLKGFEYAIEAISLVKKTLPHVKYCIAGSGTPEYKHKLEMLIQSLNLEKTVVLLGAKNDSEIAKLYASSSIFIFPSIRASNGAEEGQGLVIQEAAAAFLPAIASNIGGIPEGMIDSVTGYLVPEKDAHAIAEKITLLGAPHADELRKKMGKAAHDFAIEKYDCTNLAIKMISIYKDILY